jgi:glycosyltransferase involved in cell wall biosynthesis
MIWKHAQTADVINPHHGPAYWTSSLIPAKQIVWNCTEVPRRLSKAPSGVGPLDLLASLITSTLVERFIVRYRIDKTVVFDERNRQSFQRRYGMEARVIHPGVDYEFFRYAEGQANSPIKSKSWLITVGRLDPWKNQMLALEIVKNLQKRIPDLKLFIVGTGSLEQNLRAAARSLGIEENVLFLGNVSDDKLRMLYSACGVNLFTALEQTWGMTPFEALASGTPSVVSSDCGVADVLARERIGLVASPTVTDFSEAILALWSDSELYNQMVENGRRHIENSMSWRSYATKWLETATEPLPVSGQNHR